MQTLVHKFVEPTKWLNVIFLRRDSLNPNSACKSLEIKDRRKSLKNKRGTKFCAQICCLKGSLSPTKVSLMKIIRQSVMWKERTSF